MTSTEDDGDGDLHWYGVRCLFSHGDTYYEERITLWRARDFDAAIELAEAEAAEYSEALQDPTVPTKYLGFAQSYRLDDGPVVAGSEVFSLIRDSDLPPGDYIDRFFSTGAEHTR